MVKKYKVIYDRKLCIGAAACVESTPEGFEIDSDDGKANLINGKKIDHEVFEMILTEDQYSKFKDAEEVCPVNNCIKVIEIHE